MHDLDTCYIYSSCSHTRSFLDELLSICLLAWTSIILAILLFFSEFTSSCSSSSGSSRSVITGVGKASVPPS